MSNVRTTFVAEELERAAKASSSPFRMVMSTGDRNHSLKKNDSERVDSGIGMEQPLQSDFGGIVSGEDVERDFTEERTMCEELRQPKAEQEELRGEASRNTRLSSFPTMAYTNASATATKTAPRKTHVKHMNYTHTNVSHQLLNNKQYLQKEEKMAQYLLPNRDGDTGLHLAVILQDANALDKLLHVVTKYPAIRNSIDDQNNLYQTPLHLALHTRQHEMVRKLVISGSSLHITDHKGNTPLHIACSLDSAKCLDEILAFSSITKVLEASTIPNNEGLTCFHLAAMHGCRDILKKLRRIGVNVNAQDLHSGKTALHFAAEKQQLAETHFLVESCGLDVDARTFTGCTSLHIAAGRGCIEIVAYLLSVGANPDLQTDEGDIPLDLSVSDDVIILLRKVAALKWLY